MSWSKPKTKVGQWGKNFLIALDRLGNVLWGGDPDETISSRLGKMHQAALEGKKAIRPLPDALHDALNEIQPGHCERSIDDGPEAGDEAVVDRDIENEKHPPEWGGI